MPALAVENTAIGILKFHIMVIKYFPVILSFADLPAAHTLSPDRISAFEPIDHINIMNVLFGDMIAAKPYKIIPVAHLVFHFGLPFLAGTYPHTIIVPPCLR